MLNFCVLINCLFLLFNGFCIKCANGWKALLNEEKEKEKTLEE